MFARLLLFGARGFYRPDLIIHHYVPPERLTKQYFRRWCFWRGVSQGVLDRRRPAGVPHLLGVPRYLYRKALTSAWGAGAKTLRRDVTGAFDDELWVCFFLGILSQRWRRGTPAVGPAASPAEVS